MELDTLYISVEIKNDQLQQFFKNAPQPEHIDDNWTAWWDSRLMYDKSDLDRIPGYSKRNNRAVLEELLSDPSFSASEHYDEANQCWTFIALHFSENYIEILPMLAFLKQLAPYCVSGVALIYDWMWGGNTIMAFVQFEAGKAWLKPVTESFEIDLKLFEHADQQIRAAAEKMQD